MNRRDPTVDALLTPHNEHIVVIPVAIEQLLLRVFGMGDATPEYVVQALVPRGRRGAALRLREAAGRRLAGALRGAAGALPRTRLGGPVVAVRDQLRRARSYSASRCCWRSTAKTGAGDIAACAALAALLRLLQSRRSPSRSRRRSTSSQNARSRGLGRAYLVRVPLLLFAAWYLGWGHEAETHFALRNVMTSPRFVLDSIAVAAAGLFGLGESPLGGPGRPAVGPAAVGRPGRRSGLPAGAAARRVPARLLAGRRRGGDQLVPHRLQRRPRAGPRSPAATSTWARC